MAGNVTLAESRILIQSLPDRARRRFVLYAALASITFLVTYTLSRTVPQVRSTSPIWLAALVFLLLRDLAATVIRLEVRSGNLFMQNGMGTRYSFRLKDVRGTRIRSPHRLWARILPRRYSGLKILHVRASRFPFVFRLYSSMLSDPSDVEMYDRIVQAWSKEKRGAKEPARQTRFDCEQRP